MNSFKQISTTEINEIFENKIFPIVDVRPIAAYNGWRLNGEMRGGHIPGAKNIPFHWTEYMDWIEVPGQKGLKINQPIVLYGYDNNTISEMADKFSSIGYKEVLIYSNFVDEWAADENRPLDYLPGYKQLVHPEWVHQLINGKEQEHPANEDFVICHAHYDYIEDYHKGHIPGAIPLDTNSLESTKTWNRRNPKELEEALCRLGITHQSTVILYGRYGTPVFNEDKFPGKSAGHLGAIRCAALLLYAGVEDVRILNGGITSWERFGFEISTEPADSAPVQSFGAKIPQHPEYMIDTPEAKELLASEDGELVSIRSWEEFIGRQSGYHYIEKKGRIPGALFGNCGSDAYHMENYRNFDHTMREYPEVEKNWAENGITRDKKIAFYCGTGWRGSEAFWNAYLMGWPQVCVYDGGWFEWCSDDKNPIETGVPKTQ